MSGENNQSVKTVQTLLAPLKADDNDTENESGKEKPAKITKRTHSQVADESIDSIEPEGVDLKNIHHDLKEIKDCLQGTVKKSDLDSALNCLVKQSDLKCIVTDIVQQLLLNFEEKIAKGLECKSKLENCKIKLTP